MTFPVTHRRFVPLLLALPALLTLTHAAPAPRAAKPTAAPAKPNAAPVVLLRPTTERRGETRDAQGHVQQTWMPLAVGTAVQSGDVLRCTVQIASHSARPVQNFVLTQPIPAGLIYTAGSAGVRGAEGVAVTFRTNGRSDGFVAAPTVRVPQADGTVKVVPAPPSAFRAVRWTWAQPLAPGQVCEAAFGEEVR